MNVGYLPDMFGHVAQMPQILRLAGLEHAVVWRGVPSSIDRTAFWWEAPDGSRVRAEYLYGSYSNGRDIPDDASQLVARARGYELELGDARLDGGGMLLMNGSDHLLPQSWLGRVVDDANDATRRLPLHRHVVARVPRSATRRRAPYVARRVAVGRACERADGRGVEPCRRAPARGARRARGRAPSPSRSARCSSRRRSTPTRSSRSRGATSCSTARTTRRARAATTRSSKPCACGTRRRATSATRWPTTRSRALATEVDAPPGSTIVVNPTQTARGGMVAIPVPGDGPVHMVDVDGIAAAHPAHRAHDGRRPLDHGHGPEDPLGRRDDAGARAGRRQDRPRRAARPRRRHRRAHAAQRRAGRHPDRPRSDTRGAARAGRRGRDHLHPAAQGTGAGDRLRRRHRPRLRLALVPDRRGRRARRPRSAPKAGPSPTSTCRSTSTPTTARWRSRSTVCASTAPTATSTAVTAATPTTTRRPPRTASSTGPISVQVEVLEPGPVRARLLVRATYEWPACAIGDERSCSRAEHRHRDHRGTHHTRAPHRRAVPPGAGRLRQPRPRPSAARALPAARASRRIRRRVCVRRRAPRAHRRRRSRTSTGCQRSSHGDSSTRATATTGSRSCTTGCSSTRWSTTGASSRSRSCARRATSRARRWRCARTRRARSTRSRGPQLQEPLSLEYAVVLHRGDWQDARRSTTWPTRCSYPSVASAAAAGRARTAPATGSRLDGRGRASLRGHARRGGRPAHGAGVQPVTRSVGRARRVSTAIRHAATSSTCWVRSWRRSRVEVALRPWEIVTLRVTA